MLPIPIGRRYVALTKVKLVTMDVTLARTCSALQLPQKLAREYVARLVNAWGGEALQFNMTFCLKCVKFSVRAHNEVPQTLAEVTNKL